MSKSKFCKILIATLSLCLILGAAIGVSAFAADEKDEKGVVIDFDSDFDYSSYISWRIGNQANAAANTFEIVEVDGNKKLHLKKTATGDGMYVVPKVSYYAENGNVAILEFDVRYENVSSSANQITVSHTGGSGNNNTPFLISLPKNVNVDMHVTLTYRVTEYKANGDAAAYELVWQINDDEPTVVTSIRGGNIISGTTKLPEAADLISYGIDLNYGFTGDVYYDNFCAKVVHEHVYAGGICECGHVDESFKGIEILSKNAEYGSKTYLYYAVPVSDILVEDQAYGNVWLNVYNADGSLAFKQYPEAELVKVWGEACFIFKTHGVPAKELNTVEKVEVETASGKKSAIESYSVEEYLYERLYKEDFAAKTEADGKDYIRRNLYYNLLKYGAIAQQLLAPDAEDKIGGVSYVNADAATASLGRFEEPTKVVLRHDVTKIPASSTFLGWEYALYDEFGELIESGYAADGSSVVVDGYAVFEPVYETVNHNYNTFDDGSYGNVTTQIVGNSTHESIGTYGIVDGKYQITKSLTYNELKAKLEKWNTENPDNKVSIPGSIAMIPYVSVGTKVQGANMVEFTADFSYKSSTSLEYLEIYSGSSASSSGTKIWGIYAPNSGGYLQFNGEYITGSNRNDNVVTSPIKTDGTVYKLTIRFITSDDGSSRLEFYCDGQLFYTGRQFVNNIKPTVNDIGGVRFRMSNAPKGTLTLDNVAMSQACSKYVDTEFKLLVADEGVNDFNGVNDTKTEITTNANFKELNTWETRYDPVTGDGYLYVNKQATDTSGGANGGVSFKTSVTEKQENANLAVFEFDMQMFNASTVNANQFTMGHQGLTGNANSPFIPNYSTFATNDGKYHHVSMTYRVLTVDEAGVPIDYYYELQIDGKVVVKGELPLYKATGLKLNGGKYELPKISQVENFTFALNNSFKGEVYLDNFSLRLIHVDGYDPVLGDKLTNVPTTLENPSITFEQMPETEDLVFLTNEGYNTFETVESYTDSNGTTIENVLHFNKHTKGKNAGFTIAPTITDGTGDTLVITFDMLTTSSVGGVEFYFEKSSCLFEAQSFLAKDKWQKVTIIARESANGVKLHLYVDGVLKMSGSALGRTITDSSNVQLRWWGSTVTECYVANMSCERTGYSSLCD